ncbi:hypothetical protein F5Y08DRAFT_121022 [Xylaria arbuscula]|nr:hypothetical protein F5Y08DRAFT_121022 [Xylaria arbuscula]
MDISSLTVPRVGRSRFSKALPTPPDFDQESNGEDQAIQRSLPDAPPAPPPPMKKSVLTTSPSTTSLHSKAYNSPLPLLPIMAEPPKPRAQAGPIARKPVAQLPTPPASVEPKPKTKAAKRQSSISSLLSAYSRSSSDWAQRSSHESDFTKESEPSYSPEREGVESLPPVPAKNSLEATQDITSDKASEITSYTIIDHFPPPPPSKNPSRPRTPPPPPGTGTVWPSDGARDGEGGPASLSPPSSLKGGSPRDGREIWRRRASSKSDGSLVIAELKLPSSNGSTASTASTTSTVKAPPKKAELPSIKLPSTLPPLPPAPELPAKQGHLRAPPPPPKPDQPQPQPQQQQQTQQSVTPLPPRSTSLPGRNIRPIKQEEPADKGDEMGKLRKLKDLLRRDHGDKDDSERQRSPGEPSSKRDGQPEHQEYQNQPDAKGNIDADKPAPPAKEGSMQPREHAPATMPGNAPAPAAVEARPVASSSTAGPPLNEPGKATGTAISRRPVGATPGGGKLSINTPNAQFPSAQTPSSGTLQPRTPAGSLPHPSQRQPRSQPPTSALPQPPHSHGPTSPTAGTPRSISASTLPNQFSALTLSTGSPRQAPGTVSAGSPGSRPQPQPHPAKSLSPIDRAGYPPQDLISSPSLPDIGTTSNPNFLTRPARPNNEREATAPGSASTPASPSQQPITGAALDAVALFPRNTQLESQCTVDGVWQPHPLAERHYNCHVRHSKLTDSRNTIYPLACQTCGIADAERRFMCHFCNLRICAPCADILVANGRDLRTTMAIIRERGMMHDWAQYPKRTTR